MNHKKKAWIHIEKQSLTIFNEANTIIQKIATSSFIAFVIAEDSNEFILISRQSQIRLSSEFKPKMLRILFNICLVAQRRVDFPLSFLPSIEAQFPRAEIERLKRFTLPQFTEKLLSLEQRGLPGEGKPQVGREDFELLKSLGKGAHGKVLLC